MLEKAARALLSQWGHGNLGGVTQGLAFALNGAEDNALKDACESFIQAWDSGENLGEAVRRIQSVVDDLDAERHCCPHGHDLSVDYCPTCIVDGYNAQSHTG